jgi:hypothetical protein
MSARERWAERVAVWRASGRSATAFAAEHGLNAGTLRYYAKVLRREAPTRSVKLARVEVVRARDSESPIELELGGARVMVRRGFDRETLGELLDLLGARR